VAQANGRSTRSERSSHTLRLTFSYAGNDVRLIRSQRVAMITPPSVTPPPVPGQSGYWFEVRDAYSTLLYHRHLHAPIRTSVEVFSDGQKQPITRVDIAAPVGQFELLVPDLPAAHTFSFHASATGQLSEKIVDQVGTAPHEPLLRFTFDKLRALSPGGSHG
jgi:hypothetical protein